MKKNFLQGIFLREIFSVLIFLLGGLSASAQNMTVKGTVRDGAGEPLIGVGILVKESGQGATTDLDGQYEISVLANATVEFSYLGYLTQEIRVNGRGKVDVVLQQNVNSLDELVVIGYGTQRKRNLVGAVENVGSEVLEDKPNPNIVRSMEGQIPGLNITMVDGKPTRSASMQIRANTQSIGAGGAALCLIDGVEGDLTTLNPEDVESISVLKDASSAAVYGARGAFGVILVTTKKATEGKISVDYGGTFTAYTQTVRPQMVTDSKEWYDGYIESYTGYAHHLPSGINNFFPWTQAWEDEFYRRMSDPSYLEWGLNDAGNWQYYGRGTNWYDLFYKKVYFGQQHNLRVSGGGKKASFVVSARYYDQDGVYRVGDEKFRQINVRAKGTVHITDWLHLENNTDFVRQTYHQPITYNTSLLVPRNIEHQGYPLTVPRNPDGSWTAAAVYTGYASMADGNSFRKNEKNEFKNTTALTAEILKDVLIFKADYSFLYNHNRQYDAIVPVTYKSGPDNEITYPATGGTLNYYERDILYHNVNANLSYTPKLGDDHYLNVIVGYNLEHKSARNNRMQRDGFLRADKINFSMMDGINYTVTDNGSYDWGFMGVFYRASYNYKGKYLAEISGRYDGSSKFPTNSRWGFFPSASLGWRISDENFMKWSRNWLDNFKLRFSIGKAGNGNVNPYQYMELITVSKTSSIIDGKQDSKAATPTIVPENITWETSSTIDLGLDLNFFKNRLAITADVYWKNTTDMYVVGAEIPAVAGYSAPKGNNADMKTRGFEFSISWNDSFNLIDSPFSYNARFSLWDSRSFITRYTSKSNLLPLKYTSGRYYEGMELGEIWGYHCLGLFPTDEEAISYGLTYQEKTFWSGDQRSWNAGDLWFADLNDDGVVDNGSQRLEDHGDLIRIGNSSPRFQFGCNLGFNWYGVGISIFLQGVLKRDWYPAAETGFFWGQYSRPYGYALPWQNADRWSESNPGAYWPRLRGSLAVSGRGTLRAVNDRYLQDAKYVRLKNLTIDYTLPRELTRKAKMEKVRFFVTGDNLCFWSPLQKYAKNFDPEQITAGDSDFNSTEGDAGQGYGYPQARSVSVGVNITF